MGYFERYWSRKSGPRHVEGGIKAQSRRGAFVKNWWGDRWLAALNLWIDPGRLSRGRTYARRGQVISMQILPGGVIARVQGSQRRPYEVQITLEPLTPEQWARVLDALAEQALYAAQLLGGEMPPEIENVFEAADVPLFPQAYEDLWTDCTCYDWINPCKHVAAVYYLLGERFDQDPFLLFELRGLDKEALMAQLRARRTGDALLAETTANAPYAPHQIVAVSALPLEEAVEHYWELGAQAEQVTLHLHAPQVEMPLLKRLGAPSFIDARTLWAQMEGVYRGVAQRAVALAYSDREEG